jgi:N-methylhydantoinase B
LLSTQRLSDPITFAVVGNALTSVADEMAQTVLRTAHSQVVRDAMDFSTALCDAEGRLIAEGLCLPLHLGAISEAMGAVRKKWADGIEPGDIFILNDPHEGGMHLPDIFMFSPVFENGALFGFAACVAHHADIGGRVPGGNAVDSTEIYQEGLQIPPLKLYERGEPNRTLVDLITRNVRIPATVLGDLRAQKAACHIGEAGLLRLLGRFGRRRLQDVAGEILDHTEELVRAELRRMPEGTYGFTDYIDTDGFGSGSIAINVSVTITDGHLAVDFAGTSEQVRSALNATPSYARSAVYTALKCVMDPDIPSNDGLYRPVDVVVPEGTILNPRHPAARAARGLTGYRTVDTVLGALAQVVPERVPAAGEGGASMICIGGSDEERRPFIFVDFVTGGWGGRPTADGVDGTSCVAANLANVPVEEVELHQPIQVESYGFVPDSGGPGRWRGCLSIARQYRFLEDEGTLQIRSDRRRHRPYGLAGGEPGGSSWNVLTSDGNEEVLPTNILTRPIRRGDVLRHVTAGGGGHGDPKTRDRGEVVEDVREGKVTPEGALEQYGVTLHPDELPEGLDG